MVYIGCFEVKVFLVTVQRMCFCHRSVWHTVFMVLYLLSNLGFSCTSLYV